MSNNTENNSGPGGLVNPLPIGGEDRSPIATGAAFLNKKSRHGIIYKVTNSINGKIYIGKTIKKFWDRKSNHQYLSNHPENKDGKVPFYKAIRKYGWDNFKWEIIDTVLFDETARELERYYIKKYNSKVPNGYNCTDGGDGISGRKHSEETKKKISIAHKGLNVSREARAKISISLIGNKRTLGYKHSTLAKAKMSKIHKGRNFSADHCAKISASLMGHKCSPETKAKLSAAQIGNKSHWFGRKHTLETIKKMSIIKKNISNKTREQMSVAQKIRRTQEHHAAKEYIRNIAMGTAEGGL